MDKKDIKESLRDKLPRGFVKSIQERLTALGKASPSKAWVSRVCNPDTTNWDSDIIAEALQLANTEKLKIDELKSIADTL